MYISVQVVRLPDASVHPVHRSHEGLAMPDSSHLSAPPARSFWCDTLCFEAFDELAAEAGTEVGARALTSRLVGDTLTLRVVEEIVAEAGGGTDARANVALALAFVRERRSQAIEDAAVAFFTPPEIAEHRTRGGKVRRHALALRLFESTPESLLAIDLWDQWHTRRGAWYRQVPVLAARVDVETTNWAAIATSALAAEAERPHSRCAGFERPVVFPGSDGDVLIGFREWPHRQAVRLEHGVVTGDQASWMLLRVYDGGGRVDVTDTLADRGATLATAMVHQLRPAAGEFEQVLNELTDDVLDGFLARITADTEEFPLVEITADIPWDARHRSLTLRGRPGATAEPIVRALRGLGPFAMHWRTVKSAKLLFEGEYKIEVHFPVPGRYRAISYSDIDRDKRVTRRFAESLNRALKCEVAPKARAGSRLPRRREEPALRARSGAWWARLLAAKHDEPPRWVHEGLCELAGEGLIRCTEVGVLQCGSAHLDRSQARVDWAECKGEVELPLAPGDPDDPCQPEDDGSFECSERQHRWRPVGYRVPIDLRVRVELDHQRAWAMVMEEAGRYGAVEAEPGRPGVATVRLPDRRAFIAYTALASDADSSVDVLGQAPIARVAPPFGSTRPPPPGSVVLANVLAGDDVLAVAWGQPSLRRRRASCPAPATAAEPNTVGTTVIELHGPRSVKVGGRAVTRQVPSVGRVARLLLLSEVGLGERRARESKALVTLAKAHGILAATDTETHLHVLLRRARDGVDSAAGIPGRGEEAFVTEGHDGYRLGDGWEVRQRTERSPSELKGMA